MVHKVTDHSAEQTIARFLEIFGECGVPDEIHSDRGTNYTSSLFLAFCKGLDIKLSFSSAYHHSGNRAEQFCTDCKEHYEKMQVHQHQLETWSS